MASTAGKPSNAAANWKMRARIAIITTTTETEAVLFRCCSDEWGGRFCHTAPPGKVAGREACGVGKRTALSSEPMLKIMKMGAKIHPAIGIA